MYKIFKYKGTGDYKIKSKNKLGEWNEFNYETLQLAELEFELRKERNVFKEIIIGFKGIAIKVLEIKTYNKKRR